MDVQKVGVVGGGLMGSGIAQVAAFAEQHKLKVTVVAKGLAHPFSLSFLPNGDALVTERGGKLRLVGDHSGVLLEIDYDTKAPWPKQADGAGHSLVLARASYGENDPRAWAASDVVGGSPGRAEAFVALRIVP